MRLASCTVYRDRAEYSERVNADVKAQRTVDRMPAPRIRNVWCIALWNVLA